MPRATGRPAKSVSAQVGADVPLLTRRALNRALLARQMLLKREAMSAAEALTHLIGLQAQSPAPPYYGLWTRLKDFRAEELSELIESRRAVRMALMRSTIHLVTAEDALALHPVLQSVQETLFETGSRHGAAVRGVDMKALVKAGRRLIEAKPMTFTELGTQLLKRFPGRPVDSLGYAMRNYLALVQVPPRGLWGRSGPPAHTTVEKWLGRSLGTETAPDATILRYIAAFGPASVRDAQAWSGLPRLGETFERLRPKLLSFRDEADRELFDLRDGPRPDAETAAPVRFLPEFDNILLSHADRSRIVSEEDRKRLFGGGGILAATILIDGFVHGVWRIRRTAKTAILEISSYRRASKKATRELMREGERLLAFAAPDSAGDIRLAAPS